MDNRNSAHPTIRFKTSRVDAEHVFYRTTRRIRTGIGQRGRLPMLERLDATHAHTIYIMGSMTRNAYSSGLKPCFCDVMILGNLEQRLLYSIALHDSVQHSPLRTIPQSKFLYSGSIPQQVAKRSLLGYLFLLFHWPSDNVQRLFPPYDTIHTKKRNQNLMTSNMGRCYQSDKIVLVVPLVIDSTDS